MRILFGEFKLDAESRQLFRGGEEIHLSPKALQLLKLLVDNRPRALSKTELHDSLWPATFVSEATLAGLVAEIRAALTDDARRPRFLRTVHTYGYAFCGVATEMRAAPRAQPAGAVSYFLIREKTQMALADGENIVGRDPSADVRLDSPTVSRRHARIVIAGGEATVEDLGSRNGTYVRGERIASASTLANGDHLRFGSIVVKFCISASLDPTQSEAFA